MSKVWRLVFVCSGNICRSPMAQGMAKKRLAEAGIEAQVLSMGTLDIPGQRASRLAIEVSAEAGVDLRDHVSQGISLGILEQADLILVMEEAHRRYLGALRSDLPPIELLGSLDPEEGSLEMADPIGGSREEYERCLRRIDRSIQQLVRRWPKEGG
ncbi:MAG: hypothetical protein JW797_14475 [Bradymonadales bacterium]|nr:hypothetical protein [Bradymonadales bacterium]